MAGGEDGRDAGAPASGTEAAAGPLRRCLATGRTQPPDVMVRFVVGPDGGLVPDLERRLPGRGLWLSATRPAFERAVSQRLFARAARAEVAVPADLTERVAGLLRARILATLGLARRAGQAVAGFERVREWQASGQAGLLALASDAGADARRRMAAQAGGLPVLSLLPAAELGPVFGRDTAVNVALAPGNLARRLAADARRLAGLQDDDSSLAGGGLRDAGQREQNASRG